MKATSKYILLCTLIGAAAAADAQDSYDAQNFVNSDLNGTSRFVAMGGALGALGGDISVMSTNPAGTAMYRRSDASISIGGLFTEKGALDHDRSRMSLDQGGALITFDMNNPSGKGLQFVNFGVNYQKKRNYFSNQRTDIQHLDGKMGQSWQIASLCNEAWDNNYYGTLADMSASVFNSPRSVGILSEKYYDRDGNFLGSELLDVDDPNYLSPHDEKNVDLVNYEGFGADKAYYEKATQGANVQVDLNVSLNLSDQLFFGASVGVYDIDYKRESFYQELGMDGNAYDWSNVYKTTGDGFDVKLGFICRPIEDSPFRFGVTVHTPIWYRMTDSNSAELWYTPKDAAEYMVGFHSNDEYDYNFRTPWKFGLSLGHTIGTNFAIGAEYEYQDLGTAKYTSIDDQDEVYFRNINQITKQTLRGQHTLKVGAEFKPIDEFAIRLGYNFVSSPFKSDAYRTIGYDGVYSETDYTNWGPINRFTVGLGYRYKGGYFDVAYQYQMQKGDFYAFRDNYFDDNAVLHTLQSTKIDNNRSQLMATLGFRF